MLLVVGLFSVGFTVNTLSVPEYAGVPKGLLTVIPSPACTWSKRAYSPVLTPALLAEPILAGAVVESVGTYLLTPELSLQVKKPVVVESHISPATGLDGFEPGVMLNLALPAPEAGTTNLPLLSAISAVDASNELANQTVDAENVTAVLELLDEMMVVRVSEPVPLL